MGCVRISNSSWNEKNLFVYHRGNSPPQKRAQKRPRFCILPGIRFFCTTAHADLQLPRGIFYRRGRYRQRPDLCTTVLAIFAVFRYIHAASCTNHIKFPFLSRFLLTRHCISRGSECIQYYSGLYRYCSFSSTSTESLGMITSVLHSLQSDQRTK